MFFKDKIIYLGVIDMVKIGVLTKQQSVLTTLTTSIRKSFCSERAIYAFQIASIILSNHHL